MASEVVAKVEVMLPPTNPACWICKRDLVAVMDGNGRVGWDCPPCRKEIEAMRPRGQAAKEPAAPAAEAEGPDAVREEIIALARRNPDMSKREIAARVGRTGERVRQVLVEVGIRRVDNRQGP